MLVNYGSGVRRSFLATRDLEKLMGKFGRNITDEEVSKVMDDHNFVLKPIVTLGPPIFRNTHL